MAALEAERYINSLWTKLLDTLLLDMR
jgi:hypothetical protein